MDAESKRFWEKTQQRGECLVWTGSRNTKGYGSFKASDGRTVLAHRWAWTKANGQVPDGKELDHLCRNRACVNAAHLDPVTHPVNIQRGLGATRALCPRGHAYADAYVSPSGHRVCRTCKGQRSRLLRLVKRWSAASRTCANPECRHAFKTLRVEQSHCSKRCGWRHRNWAALCAMHHSRKTATETMHA